MNVLFAFGVITLVSTLPYFTPSNIFHATDSGIRTSNDVLFARLGALRPLTPQEEALRGRLESGYKRQVYLHLGPAVVANCSFCTVKEMSSFFYFALPTIILPHVVHLIVLGFATSRYFSGAEAARWRNAATVVGVVLVSGELYWTQTYDISKNKATFRADELDFFYWRRRLITRLSFAVADAALGYLLYLTSTNRLWAQPPSLASRIEADTRVLEVVAQKLGMVGHIRNAMYRDRSLRGKVEHYWMHEGQFSTQINEEPEVVEGTQKALTRMDMVTLGGHASKVTDDTFDMLRAVRAGPQAAAGADPAPI